MALNSATQFLAVNHKYWEVLKCGAGGGWRRSVGPIT